MRIQTGMRIDAELWRNYRGLCAREGLRPIDVFEGFLRLVVKNGSPSVVSEMLRHMVEGKPEGLDAYATVLLNWYKSGVSSVDPASENDVPVRVLLLNSLKEVADPQLREQIKRVLIEKTRRQMEREPKEERSTEVSSEASQVTYSRGTSPAEERLENLQKRIAGHSIDLEKGEELLKQIRETRERLKEKNKPRKRRG
jgi:hypothetical protein